MLSELGFSNGDHARNYVIRNWRNGVVSRQLESSQQDMKWLQPALRMDEGSWQGMRRGEAGRKAWAMYRWNLALCPTALHISRLLSHHLGDVEGWGATLHCQVSTSTCWCPSELPDLHSGALSLAASKVVLCGPWGRGEDVKMWRPGVGG